MTDLPLPGDYFDGGTVIASGYYTDDLWAVMTLRPETPYYRTALYRADIGALLNGDEWVNIVPATTAFDEHFNLWSGDPGHRTVTP